MGERLSSHKLVTVTLIFCLLVWSIGFPGFSTVPTLILVLLSIFLLIKYDVQLMSLTHFFVILSALVLLFLATGWYLVMPDADEFQVFRMYRFFINSVCIWIICNVWKVSLRDSFLILIIVLFFHGFALALQSFSLELKLFFAVFVGVEQEIFTFRGFGMSEAYDTAGAYICIAILVLYASKLWNPIFRFSLILALWTLGFSTGRTFMVVGSFVTLVLIIHSLYSKNVMKNERIIALFSLVSIIFGAGMLIATYGDLLSDTAVMMFDLDSAVSGGNHGETGYYVGSGNVLKDVSYFNLVGETEYLFGTGQTLKGSDIGFLKTIYTYGILIGPLMLLFMLYILYLVALRFCEIHLPLVGILFVGVILIYNIKMQSFFSSGYSEIIFLLLYSYRPRLSGFDEDASSVEFDMNAELQFTVPSNDKIPFT